MKKQSAKVLDYWQKISKDKTHTLHVVMIVDAIIGLQVWLKLHHTLRQSFR